MNYLIKHKREILYIFAIFWICPALMCLFSLLDSKLNINSYIIGENYLDNSLKIMFNNLRVSFIIIISGLIFRYAPVTIFMYNSIIFSITLIISMWQSGKLNTLISLMPHAFPEVLGLAIFTLLGMNIKSGFKDIEWIKAVLIGSLVIVLSAFIEGFISGYIGGKM
jgi:uncharacterized membrane protein SpoIIM required for sporulation